MTTKEEIIRRGQAANALLESEDFKISMKAIKDATIADWERSRPADTESRERYFYLLLAIRALENLLHSQAASGTIEERIKEEAVIRNQAKPPLNEEDYE